MTVRLTLRALLVLFGMAAILIAGLIYLAVIQWDVSGSFVVGQVQAAEETILLYSQVQPSFADLTEVNFGNLAAPASIPFWAANVGGVSFELTVGAVDVQVNGTPSSGPPGAADEPPRRAAATSSNHGIGPSRRAPDPSATGFMATRKS